MDLEPFAWAIAIAAVVLVVFCIYLTWETRE